MPRRRRPPRPGALADLSPKRIATQIVVLQFAYYACAAVLILFTALVAGKELSLDLLFSWRSLRGDTAVGWTLGLIWVLNSLAWYVWPLQPLSTVGEGVEVWEIMVPTPYSVFFILILIARSKLVLDFALTIHFIHLLVTSFYTHEIPSNMFWWALQVFSSALMTSLGVWACQWRELRPITFGGTKIVDALAPPAGAPPAEGGSLQGANGDVEGGDEEAGFIRGGRRGRGRDGAGEYEMIGMEGSGKRNS